jgi:hypothetical protein
MLRYASDELHDLATIFENIADVQKMETPIEGGVLVQTIKAVRQIEEVGRLENTKTIFRHAMLLQTAAGGRAPAEKPGAAPAATTAGPRGGGAGEGEKEVVLKLNEIELGRVVVNIIRDKYNLKIAKG